MLFGRDEASRLFIVVEEGLVGDLHPTVKKFDRFHSEK